MELANAALDVTRTELQAKIDENEKLHKEVYEANSMYTQHVNNFQNQIAHLRHENEELQAELDSTRVLHEEIKSTSSRERKILERELGESKEELQRVLGLMQEHEAKVRRCEETIIQCRNLLMNYVALTDDTVENIGTHFNMLTPAVLKDQVLSDDDILSVRTASQSLLSALKSDPSDGLHHLVLDSSELRDRGDSWMQAYVHFAAELKDSHPLIRTALSQLVADRQSLEAERDTLSEQLEQRPANVPAANARDDVQVNMDEEDTIKVRPETREQSVQVDLSNWGGSNVPQPAAEEDEKVELDEDDFTTGKTSSGIADLENVLPEALVALSLDTAPPSQAHQTSEARSVDSGEGLLKSTVESEQPAPLVTSPRPPPMSDVPTTLVAADEPSNTPVEKQSIRKVKQPQVEYVRESLIKRHYETKLHRLTEKVHLADTRAVRFHQAWVAAQQQVQSSVEEATRHRNEAESLREEMRQTQINFQRQMDAMAEHVAALTANVSTAL